MNKLRFVIILISIVFAALIFTVNGSADPIPGSFTLYLPAIEHEEQAPLDEEVVVNHLTTDIQAIPDEWITAARASVIHFAHTSHGSQILTGLGWLENYDSNKYSIDVTFSTSAPPNPEDGLGFYDGNSYGSNYITPDMYWESPAGIVKTYETLGTGYFDYTLWTWCGQMSSYSNTQVNTYLNVLDQIETDFPDTRAIYFTGHTDGTTPGSGSTLWANNNLVRSYVAANDKILFDFADIETYDPSGGYYPSMNGTDGCSWCETWCNQHPEELSCQIRSSGCAHSPDGLQCALKAQAFWWLMARLAGWDGTPAQ